MKSSSFIILQLATILRLENLRRIGALGIIYLNKKSCFAVVIIFNQNLETGIS